MINQTKISITVLIPIATRQQIKLNFLIYSQKVSSEIHKTKTNRIHKAPRVVGMICVEWVSNT